jgi:tRNA(Ile)-lysidine synthase
VCVAYEKIMLNSFTTFIKDRALFKPEDKILLAVSGGIDSMVMWHLFEESGFKYGVIHCNFQLRGKDSDVDETFVRETAEKSGIRVFVKRFDTLEYARLSGISVEMAARELRYKWFEEVRLHEKYDFLATAHHQDDLIETFFINLVRKTGIRGMTGFREKSGTLIRPLLFASRAEIVYWAKEAGIIYHQDYTNDEVVFQRNFIRHEIIPRLETLNSAFRNNLSETIGNLRNVEEFYQKEVKRQIRKISNQESMNPEIYISSLMKLSFPRQVLYEWMSIYGFNHSSAEALYNNLAAESGKQYYSKTHRLVKDRNNLIITALPEDREETFYIEPGDLEIFDPVHLSLENKTGTNFKIIQDVNVACLDNSKLEFPLVIRKWKPGEYFQPLGMNGYKKISDFFTDEKLSIPEKEETWILFSSNKIVWIIGRRIDNRFKVTPDTREVLLIRLFR